MASLSSPQDTLIPADPGKLIDQTSTAWETFIQNGQFSEGKPRPVIASSWEQCREIGIDPEAIRAPIVLSFERLKEYMQGHELGRCGVDVLDNYSDLLSDSEHALVLADRQGQMLHSVGQIETQKS